MALRVALGQVNVCVGDIAGNMAKMPRTKIPVLQDGLFIAGF